VRQDVCDVGDVVEKFPGDPRGGGAGGKLPPRSDIVGVGRRLLAHRDILRRRAILVAFGVEADINS
jgi:hypothetical protein